MTKEEEAIEYIQKQIDYYKEQIKFIEAVDSDYYDEEYELYKIYPLFLFERNRKNEL